MQETGELPRLVQNTLVPCLGGGPASIFLSAGQLAASLAANRKLEQIKRTLSGLQLLTGAALAASVVGIGVSAAGFALVLQRLDEAERALVAVKKEVIANRLVTERIDVRLASRDWARTQALLRQSEEAWERSDAEAIWRRLGGPLYEEQLYWRGLVEGKVGPSLFCDARFTLAEAALAYESALTLASTRVQSLLLLNERPAACHHAREFHEWHERVVSGLRSVDVATARSRHLADEKGLSEADAYALLLQQTAPLMDSVHETRLHVLNRPTVIRYLMDREIAGRDYVTHLRERRDIPLVAVGELVLPGGPDG
jgi:hypothetical protein